MSLRALKALVGCFVFLCASDLGIAQHLRGTIHSDDAIKNARFRGVKTFSVGFLGAWDYPDRDRLEQFAKAEARRFLPGITYKARPTDAESAQAFAEGSHLVIYVDVQLAWSPDETRDYTAANVETIFDVRKRGAVDQYDPPAGQLNDVARTEAKCVISASRRKLTESTERGITANLEVLANGFFESR
jgi:hypothetical protein